MKNKHQKQAKIIKKRWDQAVANRNATEAYAAAADYRSVYETYLGEFKDKPYGWPDTEQDSRAISDMGEELFEMEHHDRLHYSGAQKKQAYEELAYQNRKLGSAMKDAIRRGDVEAYEMNSSKNRRNIEAMDRIAEQIESEGEVKNFRNDTLPEMNELYENDYKMRNALADKIGKITAKGKQPSEELKAAYDKYAEKVRHDEKVMLDYQARQRGENINAKINYGR